MNDTNRILLEEVIEGRLTEVKYCNGDDENSRQYFREAMDAVAKQIEIDKIDANYQEQLEKLDVEREKLEADKEKFEVEREKLEADKEKHQKELDAKAAEAKKDRMVQIGIFVGGLVVGKCIDYAFERAHVTRICHFEKDYTFTTSPGRALGKLFRFKK
ncbi:MAG: hypothetical protein IKY27_00170 [Bacteroidales bacterium]|nr:hypothetical protein [Bacteroidales bacterium]